MVSLQPAPTEDEIAPMNRKSFLHGNILFCFKISNLGNGTCKMPFFHMIKALTELDFLRCFLDCEGLKPYFAHLFLFFDQKSLRHFLKHNLSYGNETNFRL
jgi:hypothetical protein